MQTTKYYNLYLFEMIFVKFDYTFFFQFSFMFLAVIGHYNDNLLTLISSFRHFVVLMEILILFFI